MEGLIRQEIQMVIEDIDEDQLSELAQHLTSPEIGVRSVERLYDIEVTDMLRFVSKCDASKLFREWQKKFRKYL